MTDLASLVVRMQADNSQYVKALDQATQKLQKFSKDQESILNDLASKFAAAFTVDKIVSFAESAIESQASLEKFSQTAGVSVETLSQLSLAAAAAGLTQDDLGQSFKKLNVAISQAAGDAGSKAGIAFKLLGINVKDANGNIKDAAAVNAEVADAFAGSADGANKVAIAIALYGKQGQDMIPILDKGSAGLREFQQAAIDAGVAISGDTAKAALELEEKMNTLTASIKGGLGNAIANNLVPAFLAMSDAFGGAAQKGEAVRVLGEGIADVLKIAAGIALEVAREFELVGSAIGGAAAAVVAAAHGNFSEANTILKQQSADALDIDAKFTKAQKALWDTAAQDQVKAAIVGAEGAKDAAKNNQLGSLAGGIKSAAADKEIEKFSAALKEQAGAFGLGAEASVRYKLSFGPLADALAIAGDAGKKAAAAAIQYAKALQFKIDTKTSNDLAKSLTEQIAKLNQSDVAAFKYKITTGELGDAFTRMGAAGAAAQAKLIGLNNALIDEQDRKALQAINDQLDTLNGKLVAATAHAFDLKNQSLTQNLQARGDTAGLAQVDALKQKEVAQAAYNEQVEKAAVIEQQYATEVARVNLLQSTGAITELQAQKQLNDAQLQQIAGLQQIAIAEQKIAQDSGLPKLIQETGQFQNKITALQATTNQMTNQVRQGFETSFGDEFDKVITGAESARKAVTNFIQDIYKQFAQLISKNFAQQLFGTGGAAGGAPGFFASLFSSGGGATLAGGFAGGGTIPSGQFGMVGEDGPELAYAGSKNLQIQPMGQGGGGINMTNHFAITSPNGTISRQSQMQTAANLASQLAVASRRNNR